MSRYTNASPRARARTILIIGAGASGLMAGCELVKKGFQVTIVEARERIGGRIHTLTTGFSIPVEAGAEFIHGKYPLTLKLVDECASGKSRIEGNRYELRKDVIKKGDFFNDDWSALEKALQRQRTDMSMSSFLNAHFPRNQFEELHQHVKGFVEGFDAGDIEKISTLSLKKEWGGSDEEYQYHIHGGYAQAMNYLKKKFEDGGGIIHLSSPVEEIRWKKNKVKVITTDKNIFESDKIIITVPIGVLQKANIQFTPRLRAHSEAIKSFGYGGVIKFLLEFQDPFWRNSSRKEMKNPAFIVSDAVIPTWWSQLPEKNNLLTGWFGGPSTLHQHHKQESLLESALLSLHYIFKNPLHEISNKLVSWHVADWVKDPFAFGAYTYDTVKTKEARLFMNLPFEETIYFAGEAFYRGPAMGTVEAALVSGRNVAKEVNA